MAFKYTDDPAEVPAIAPIQGAISLPRQGFRYLDEAPVASPVVLQEAGFKGTGQFPSIDQPVSALARGGLNALTAGISEALARKYTGETEFDPNNPLVTNPYFNFAGETVSNFIPAGQVARGAKGALGVKSLGQQIKEGFKTGAQYGGVYGAGAGVAETIGEEDPTLGSAVTNILQEGAKGAGAGAALGTTLPVAVRGIEKYTPSWLLSKGSATFKKQAQEAVDEGSEIIADIGKFTKQKPIPQQRVISGQYTEALPEIKLFLGDPKKADVPTFLDAAQNALDQRSETFREVIKNSSNDVFNNKDVLRQRIDNSLYHNIPDPTARAKAMASIENLIQNTSTADLLDQSRALNADLTRYYKSLSPEASADNIFAKKAVRDVFSDIIEDAHIAQNIDPSVYSNYGKIAELQGIIGDKYLQDKVSDFALRGQEKGTRFSEGTKAGGVAGGIRNVVDPMIRGESDRLDSQVRRLFGPVSKKIDKYRTAPATPPPIKPYAQMTPQELSDAMAASSATGLANRQAEATTADLERILTQKAGFTAAEEAANREMEQLQRGLTNKSLAQIKQEGLAANATPEELSQYLGEQAAAARSQRALEAVAAKGIESVAATEKRLARDVIKADVEGPNGLLSDFYYLKLKGLDTARTEGELARRLTLKKDSKSWGDIRDALGIPQPIEGMNLPKARELNLEEIIRNNQMR